MQVIKYKWLGSGSSLEPFIFVKNRGEIERIRLLNEKVSFSVGDKRCIGYFRNGRHTDCPGKRAVESGWHCGKCRISDDFFLCVKCTGSECINIKQRPSCRETRYFIYLAAFDSLLKVGVSYEYRLVERLVEQGADFGAKIASVTDGKDVRVIEHDIKSYLNIADRVTGDQKQKLLFGDPNKSIQNISGAIASLRNNGVSRYMVVPEVYDLREYYSLENVLESPSKISVTDGASIRGVVVAAKGNIVVVRSGGRFLSFNSHDVIGRDIATEKISESYNYA